MQKQPWIWNVCIVPCDCDLVLHLIEPRAALSSVKHWWQAHSLYICRRDLCYVVLLHTHTVPLSLSSIFKVSKSRFLTRSLFFMHAHMTAQTPAYKGRGLSECDIEGISAGASCDITQELDWWQSEEESEGGMGAGDEGGEIKWGCKSIVTYLLRRG